MTPTYGLREVHYLPKAECAKHRCHSLGLNQICNGAGRAYSTGERVESGASRRPKRCALLCIIKNDATSSGQGGDKSKAGDDGVNRAIPCAAEPDKQTWFLFVEVRSLKRCRKRFGYELRWDEGGRQNWRLLFIHCKHVESLGPRAFEYFL